MHKLNIMTQLSIIIPFFNVEKYIHACLESVFSQGLDEDDFEVILVNDGSKDRSMEICTDFIARHKNIIVINQENQGLSVARNNGISKAKGEYILMIDSDDLLIEHSLPDILTKALEEKTDMLIADFLIMNNEEIKLSGIHLSPQENIEFIKKTGQELFLGNPKSRMCYVWHILYRKNFLIENNILFVPGIYYEDVPFIHECYLKAQSGIITNKLLNIYRKRNDSITGSPFNKKKAIDYCIVIGKTWDLMSLSHLSPQMKKKLESNIYTIFLTMLYGIIKFLDTEEGVEVLDFLRKRVPNLLFSFGKKQQLESYVLKYWPSIDLSIRRIYLEWKRKKLIN